MSYETDTKLAYRSPERAARYRQHQTADLSWARFVTWRQQRKLARVLRRENWAATDRLLDAPCGSGILAGALGLHRFRITGSDIAIEMMDLARAAYATGPSANFVQADITALPFTQGSFACVVVLGFMHRVPPAIRQATLMEIYRISDRMAIVSYSLDSTSQRIKRTLLRQMVSEYRSAPNPVTRAQIDAELMSAGFIVKETFSTVLGLSAEMVFVLEKTAPSELARLQR